MRQKKLPPELRDDVRDYYQLRFADGKMFDEEVIMSDLSPLRRQRILKHNAGDLYIKVPLLLRAASINKSFVQDVAGHVESVLAFEGDVIFTQGKIGDAMFFINTGTIEIQIKRDGSAGKNQAAVSKEKDKDKDEAKDGKDDAGKDSKVKGDVKFELGEGCYFGETSCVMAHAPRRTGTAMCTQVANMYSLKKEKLLEVLQVRSSSSYGLVRHRRDGARKELWETVSLESTNRATVSLTLRPPPFQTSFNVSCCVVSFLIQPFPTRTTPRSSATCSRSRPSGLCG